MDIIMLNPSFILAHPPLLISSPSSFSISSIGKREKTTIFYDNKKERKAISYVCRNSVREMSRIDRGRKT